MDVRQPGAHKIFSVRIKTDGVRYGMILFIIYDDVDASLVYRIIFSVNDDLRRISVIPRSTLYLYRMPVDLSAVRDTLVGFAHHLHSPFRAVTDIEITSPVFVAQILSDSQLSPFSRHFAVQLASQHVLYSQDDNTVFQAADLFYISMDVRNASDLCVTIFIAHSPSNLRSFAVQLKISTHCKFVLKSLAANRCGIADR